jgi:putative sigma-54 modulation protein
MMRVTYGGKSAQLADRDRQYAERKLQRLSRYFNGAREAHLHHRTERGMHLLEVQLDLDGILLRAEERAHDLHAGVDAVAEKLEQQVRRLKEKLQRHRGRADAPTVAAAFAELEEEPQPHGSEALPRVVRRKRFAIKPMTADEAALQMELLHHDFHAFLDAESGLVCVLYRRRDGDYGLLEIED